MSYKIKKTVIIEMEPRLALFIKAAFQNCEHKENQELYSEIFDLFPSFEEIEKS